MTQNREIPKAELRTGEDFEWVNHWAASGAAPRRYVRAQDQLHRDMAEIAAARDALIAQAQEQTTPFRIPPAITGDRSTIAGTRPRNRDSVPILVGGLLATILLVAFGAVASIMQLGR